MEPSAAQLGGYVSAVGLDLRGVLDRGGHPAFGKVVERLNPTRVRRGFAR
jgi:hypothetical protein